MEPYTYARLKADRRRYTLLGRLADALYTAMADLQDHRAVPLGIRQGRRVLFRHSRLVKLHGDYHTQLAAGDHWGVVQAPETVVALIHTYNEQYT